MRRTPRFQVVALSVLCLAVAASFQPGRPQGAAVAQATIEPSLPLAIDLKITPADLIHGEPPRLEVTLRADADISDVDLSLILPAGLRTDAAPDGTMPHPGALARGEGRSYSVALAPLRAGDLPIKAEASVRLPDGRTFRMGQGTLWRRGPAAPQGRDHAGAYEVMGVPVDEPQP